MDYFDLHCDTITVCSREGLDLDNGRTQVSLRLAAGFERYCQVFAIFIPDNLRGESAAAFYDRNIAYLRQQLDRFADRAALYDGSPDRNKIRVIPAVEGGHALAGDIDRVARLRQDGIRLITLTWNAENELGGGADTNVGLTAFGKQAVAAMEEEGILADVSHLSERAFWDLAEIARRPFVASHSNAFFICPHRRNLKDSQFRQIVAAGGLVGVNYHRYFLTRDGKDASYDQIARHVYHFLSLGGRSCLAMGSDFDGGKFHPSVDSLEKIAKLYEYMLKLFSDEALLNDLFYGNASRFFSRRYGANRDTASGSLPADGL